MVKVQKTDRKISPFGGINFVIDEIEAAGIPQLIIDALGKRHKRAVYSYSDAILAMIYGIFCGADRLEDMGILKARMHNSCLNIPSPDQIARIFKQYFVTQNTSIRSTAGKEYDFNINPKLNGLMLDMAFQLKQLKKEEAYTLDYDNTCLHCEKYDAEFTYKGERGYQPGIAWINECPVYIEGMNGNNPARFGQLGTLKRAFELLDAKGIQVKRFRADNASYQPGIIKMMDNRGIEFFVRVTNKLNVWESITDVFDWEETGIGHDYFDIAEFPHTPFGGKKEYRCVVTRRPHATGEIHKQTGHPYIYRCILTNNTEMTSLEVVDFYNQRGAIEKNFDMMNNDWCWDNLPFSFLNENTAFMLISAMGAICYKYLVQLFSSRVDFVDPVCRIKAFRFQFINVSAEWNGDCLMIHDTSRPWEDLMQNRAS